MRFLLLIVWMVAGIAPAAAQGLVFSDLKKDVGTISEDDAPRLYRFAYRNTSKKPVVILRVVTTCGCTQPAYSRQPIAPGGEGEVSVTFHPRGRAGSLHKALFVYTNESETKPVAELALIGVVAPTTDQYFGYRHHIGPLRLRQEAVNFRTVTAVQQRVMRIEVVNAGRRHLRLSAMGLPKYAAFRTEPAVIAPDSVADLVFTLRPSKADAPDTLDQMIYLDGLGEPLAPSRRAIRLQAIIR
ncbi:MAG: DUF1573 domain-containing protein [Alistipes sp.]